MSNIIQRIAKFAESKGISIRQLELAVGAGNGTFSRAIKDDKDIQAKWLSKIIEIHFDLNPAWLLSGKGEMLLKKGNLNLSSENEHLSDGYNDPNFLKKGNEKGNLISNLSQKNTPKNTPNDTPKELKLVRNTPAMPKVIGVDSSGEENIFFVPHKVSAGYLTGYADPEFMGTLPSYRLPNLNNGTYRMFEVKGHSMKPTVNDGDKVIGLWIDPFEVRDERVYVIVSKEEGITIKRCINRISEYGKLILKPDNREYNDVLLSAEDILEVWDVKMYLSAKLPAPSESFYAISDLQARMIMLEDIVKRNLKG